MPDLDFPDNVTEILVDVLGSIADPKVMGAFDRPLLSTDPEVSIGVTAIDWQPRDFVIGQYDPAVASYLYVIQGFIKHSDTAEGIAAHNKLAKTIRTMLYRNQNLRVRLGELNVTSLGATERTQRMGIRQQRFLSNEAPQGTFLYLSTTEFWLETEIV